MPSIVLSVEASLKRFARVVRCSVSTIVLKGVKFELVQPFVWNHGIIDDICPLSDRGPTAAHDNINSW